MVKPFGVFTEFAKATFQRGVLHGHVIAIAQQTTLYSFDQVRATRSHVQILSGIEQGIPDGHAVSTVFDINLVAALFGIARAGNDEGRVGKSQSFMAEKADVMHVAAKNPFHEGIGFRALHGQW